jgi:hypothetical protein
MMPEYMCRTKPGLQDAAAHKGVLGLTVDSQGHRPLGRRMLTRTKQTAAAMHHYLKEGRINLSATGHTDETNQALYNFQTMAKCEPARKWPGYRHTIGTNSSGGGNVTPHLGEPLLSARSATIWQHTGSNSRSEMDARQPSSYSREV